MNSNNSSTIAADAESINKTVEDLEPGDEIRTAVREKQYHERGHTISDEILIHDEAVVVDEGTDRDTVIQFANTCWIDCERQTEKMKVMTTTQPELRHWWGDGWCSLVGVAVIDEIEVIA